MCFGVYFMFVTMLIIPAILVDEYMYAVYDLPVRVISRAGHYCIGNYYFMYYLIDYFYIFIS